MKNKEKDFDAVKMMRQIRDDLSKKYKQEPDLRKERLEEIHEKYGLKDTDSHSVPRHSPAKQNHA